MNKDAINHCINGLDNLKCALVWGLILEPCHGEGNREKKEFLWKELLIQPGMKEF